MIDINRQDLNRMVYKYSKKRDMSNLKLEYSTAVCYDNKINIKEVTMHMNIWLNDELMKGVEAIMKAEDKKRNTVIAHAVKEYVQKKHRNEWPDAIKNFSGIKGLKDWGGFEVDRNKLKETKDSMFGEKE
jgi:hypothetical protein